MGRFSRPWIEVSIMKRSISWIRVPLAAAAAATLFVAPGVLAGAGTRNVTGASSNLNLEPAGQTIPNAAILPGAQIVIYTQTGTNLVADISGFFRS